MTEKRALKALLLNHFRFFLSLPCFYFVEIGFNSLRMNPSVVKKNAQPSKKYKLPPQVAQYHHKFLVRLVIKILDAYILFKRLPSHSFSL